MTEIVTDERIRQVDNSIKNGGPNNVSAEQQNANVKNAYRDSQEAESAGVRTPTSGANSGAAASTTEAPPKASAAPKGDSNKSGTSLADALNEWQQKLVESGEYEIADQYEIKFLGGIGGASVTKEGGTNQAATPMPANNTAKQKVDPKTNSMDTSGRTEQIVAGTQITEFIDRMVRSSSYISEQQILQTDEVTGEVKPNANTPKDGTTWFTISTSVESLGWDKKRNDYAYKITYIVAPYLVADVESQYFTKPNFYGVHKSYDYWFTGKNTAVLNYEQSYNGLWFQTISAARDGKVAEQRGISANPSSIPKSYQAASGQNNQGAKNNANEGAANLADYLYNPNSLAEINLRIIGDPAWLAQGMASGLENVNSYNYAAFLPDGTINLSFGEIFFDITWNSPVDYDFDTGIMDVTAPPLNVNTSLKNQSMQNFLYKTMGSTSYFRGGKFEQEIKGTIYNVPLNDTSKDPDGRPAPGESTTREPQSATESISVPNGNPDKGSNTSTGSDRSAGTSPALPPAAPASNGTVVPQGAAVVPATQGGGAITNTASQQMAAKDA